MLYIPVEPHLVVVCCHMVAITRHLSQVIIYYTLRLLAVLWSPVIGIQIGPQCLPVCVSPITACLPLFSVWPQRGLLCFSVSMAECEHQSFTNCIPYMTGTQYVNWCNVFGVVKNSDSFGRNYACVSYNLDQSYKAREQGPTVLTPPPTVTTEGNRGWRDSATEKAEVLRSGKDMRYFRPDKIISLHYTLEWMESGASFL